MAVDGKFEIIRPTIDRLVRADCPISVQALLNPLSTDPLALCHGELVTLNALGQIVRASDATLPSWFYYSDRGDTGVQASRKGTVIMGGGAFVANTPFYASSGLTTFGTALKWGSSTIEGVSRSGLVAQGGSGIILGYLLKPASGNNNLLQFISTLT